LLERHTTKELSEEFVPRPIPEPNTYRIPFYSVTDIPTCSFKPYVLMEDNNISEEYGIYTIRVG
jgi:hypothetical protein